MPCAIQVENLSKRYLIAHNKVKGYRSIRSDITEGVRNFFSRKQGMEPEEFWALRDISFELQQGERLGIIGHNGAGKSTLLKILSRITEPTRGIVRLKGRVSTLLEVGTGFHLELTGRENIFLNGAILGMHHGEIQAKFDQIVEFSEVEKFLDTPVKFYSSGMRVRLAFAVAAHLEPEILIVDEVLAVGDTAFQKKCIGKMQNVAGEGRTVIFVTHDMSAVETLCDRAMLLDHGRIRMNGKVSEVLPTYLAEAQSSSQNDLSLPSLPRRGNGRARFTWIELQDMQGGSIASVSEGRPFRLMFRLRAEKAVPVGRISFTLTDQRGRQLLSSAHYDSMSLSSLPEGESAFAVDINPNPLLGGITGVDLECSGSDFIGYDRLQNAFSFVVGQDQDNKDMDWRRPGVVNLSFAWRSGGGPAAG